MAANSTLLCIHPDPTQLSLLEQSGYDLVTATNGHDGLRLFMLRPVDAIVVDYYLGLLDGGVVAAEIKKVKPQVPIVMLAPYRDLPVSALKAVDAIVVKSDGLGLLLGAIRSVLDVKPMPSGEIPPDVHAPGRRPATSRDGTERRHPRGAEFATTEKDAPFSQELWKSIRDGIVRF